MILQLSVELRWTQGHFNEAFVVIHPRKNGGGILEMRLSGGGYRPGPLHGSSYGREVQGFEVCPRYSQV